MTIDRKMLCSALALALLAGCTPNDTGIGDAARANYAAQIVEPEPQYAEAMTASGDQAMAAQERYRKGAVKQPVAEKTTSGISSSGGSSSGGN
ncbi:hypothetical protein [Sphingorhabdus sp.]|jgi:type IV pilus biogenesis protein CpaD/CtpE|uniref:hypothetical protein n=1 Tax=Sphingorhabdus sp. TaxID=1902408 RepID=UPI002C8FD1B1|nr:hypothetical protein [Sphingorhabdus sp.]HMT41012.1 hypothetical protein [Sphingorhabdus sp.]